MKLKHALRFGLPLLVLGIMLVTAGAAFAQDGQPPDNAALAAASSDGAIACRRSSDRRTWGPAMLTVPVTSVMRVNGQYFAFVAEKSDKGIVAKQRAIQLGDIIGNDYVVKGGLKAGEQLIVGGLQKIGDGAPVSVASMAAAPSPSATGPNKGK